MDQFEFSALGEMASSLTRDTLNGYLESKKYNPNKTSEWVDNINNQIIAQLRELSPNFKYLVSTTLLQKVGAGLHVEAATFWDSTSDGSITVKYENDTLIAISIVFGIAM